MEDLNDTESLKPSKLNAALSFHYLGQCRVNLDALTGQFPPLLVQNGEFVYPDAMNDDGQRILKFGMISILIYFPDHNSIVRG